MRTEIATETNRRKKKQIEKVSVKSCNHKLDYLVNSLLYKLHTIKSLHTFMYARGQSNSTAKHGNSEFIQFYHHISSNIIRKILFSPLRFSFDFVC